MWIDPSELLPGTTLLVVPHMDDGVLAAGGTIARHPHKERIHIVYATDGMGSPEPVIPWRDAISPDLGAIRAQEAREAMGYLGISQQQIHFLGLPDGHLGKRKAELARTLSEEISHVKPDTILLPFRFDRHPDHLSINHVLTAGQSDGDSSAQLVEYFVYYRWRMLPGGDVRKYVRPGQLFGVDLSVVSAQKRAALDLFKSQTTRFYSWQTGPNLTPHLLDEVSAAPECFVRYNAALPGAAIFERGVPWIRVAHRAEPLLKKRKDQVAAIWSRNSGA